MSEIEASSRLYQEGGAHVMTAILLTQPEKERDEAQIAARTNGAEAAPLVSPVTFILAGNRIVTVRYITPRAFSLYLLRAQKKDASCTSGVAVLVGVLEAVIDRAADRVERIQAEVDALSQTIFAGNGGEEMRARRFDLNIRTIGREGELTSRSRESLLSLDRLLTFLAHAMGERGDEKALRARVKTASRDVQSLADHVGYLSTKITFLLDATLGMINNEQNTIIKIFSVLAVALMPPTLVGTVYGMNFKHIPELDWIWGYPFALALMVVSAVLPWLYFKRKGWL
jgi:magnesium transporter